MTCECRKAEGWNLSSRSTLYHNNSWTSSKIPTDCHELGVDLCRYASDALKILDWNRDGLRCRFRWAIGKKCRECWMNLSSRTLHCARNKWTEQRHPLESISDTFTVDSATARTHLRSPFCLVWVDRFFFLFARSVRSTRLCYLNFPTVLERENVSSLLITTTIAAV